MDEPGPTTINLGAEYDRELWSAITEVMSEIGATRIDAGWWLGGSQWIDWAEFRVRGSVVRVEGETYMGVSLTGDDALVAEIADRVARKHPAPREGDPPSI